MTGQAQIEVQGILFKHKWTKLFYCKCDQTLGQVAQKSYGVSILADVQTPTGHNPGQAALMDPALSRCLRLDKLLSSLPTSVIQWLLLTCRWKNAHSLKIQTYYHHNILIFSITNLLPLLLDYGDLRKHFNLGESAFLKDNKDQMFTKMGRLQKVSMHLLLVNGPNNGGQQTLAQ